MCAQTKHAHRFCRTEHARHSGCELSWYDTVLHGRLAVPSDVVLVVEKSIIELENADDDDGITGMEEEIEDDGVNAVEKPLSPPRTSSRLTLYL